MLAELGIDGLIVAWDFEMPDTLPDDWQIAQRWTDGYVYHRRKPLAHVRAQSGEGLSGADVRMIENSRHRVIAHVTPSDAAQPVSLLFSRPFFPGYKASLDGTALPVTAYRGLIPMIEVPAGASGRLELFYRPMPLVIGGGISLGSVALLIGSLVILSRRKAHL